jgi:hypothetical protein
MDFDARFGADAIPEHLRALCMPPPADPPPAEEQAPAQPDPPAPEQPVDQVAEASPPAPAQVPTPQDLARRRDRERLTLGVARRSRARFG